MTISQFLSSLRLLDLDKHPDWPNITLQTFSTKDAQQSQKNRIRCVEWALFRLFELYDGEETRNKLQPFFPPLEPLQSLNLRAALFRCLSELKKNGVLGRDIVLRKTMLDECKGERFEEVLAVFAGVVVKKRVVGNERGFVTHLATATSLTAEEQNILQPLTIAHRASLANRLRTREELRGRYEDFGGLVELKRRQLVRREEELLLSGEEHKKEPVIGEDEARALREKWRENWPGDEESLGAIINGDVRHGNDALLNERYDRVWDKVENGRLGEIEAAKDSNLLQELDGRVRDHRRRLEKWKEFRRGFDKRAGEQQKPKSATTDGEAKQQQPPFGLSFDAHKGLLPELKSPLKHMPPMKAQSGASQTDEAGSAHEYKRLLQSMEAELEKVGKSRRNGGTGWRRNRKENVGEYSLDVEEDEDMSRANLEVPKRSVRAAREYTPKDEVVVKEMPEPVEQEGDLSDVEPAQQETDDKDEREMSMFKDELGAASPETSSDEYDELSVPKVEPASSKETPAKKLESPKRKTRISLAGPSEQELLAEQILSSVTNSEPSPVKPPLTLVERTRMSMAPKNNRLSVLPWSADDDDDNAPEPAPRDPAFDLMERTRKSMSVFQAPPPQNTQQRNSRARKSTAPQARKSTIYSPPLPETPNKYQTFGSSSSTPREELFSQEADYASVFKSRPKIALSPTFSPAVGEEWEDEMELPGPGLDESLLSVRDEWLDRSSGDEGGAAERWESPSPLVRARDRGRAGR